MNFKKLLIFVVFFLPQLLFAQDFTGIWVGELYVDSTKQHLPYEITISEFKGKLSGFSHMEFEEEGKQKFDFRNITIRQVGSQFILEDDDIIENTRSKAPPKQIKKTIVINVSQEDTNWVMKGKWSTNRTKRFLSATGTITLKRKINFKETVVYKKVDSLALTAQLKFNEPIKVTPPPIKPIAEIVPPPEPEWVGVKFLAGKVGNTIKRKPIDNKLLTKVNKRNSPRVIPKPLAIFVSSKKEEDDVVAVVKPQPVKKDVVEKSVVQPEPVPVVKQVVKKADVVYVDKNLQSQSALDLESRTTKTNESLFFYSDSLSITLYDNGTIDGDTVSVIVNGQMFIAKKGLDVKPNSKTFYITESTPDSLLIVMYAENLGSIPPNTGLLVIRDGDKTHEVRFSADLKSNAAILLRRKK
jgi:hypothetical protein